LSGGRSTIAEYATRSFGSFMGCILLAARPRGQTAFRSQRFK
jgi:hypothetical protein